MKMLIKRQRLGTTYTKSPAQNVQTWLAVNLGNIFFTIFIMIAYLIVLYVIIMVLVFIAQEVGNTWHDINYNEAYTGPYGLLLKVIGFVLIILYVFKDRPAKRG